MKAEIQIKTIKDFLSEVTKITRRSACDLEETEIYISSREEWGNRLQLEISTAEYNLKQDLTEIIIEHGKCQLRVMELDMLCKSLDSKTWLVIEAKGGGEVSIISKEKVKFAYNNRGNKTKIENDEEEMQTDEFKIELLLLAIKKMKKFISGSGRRIQHSIDDKVLDEIIISKKEKEGDVIVSGSDRRIACIFNLSKFQNKENENKLFGKTTTGGSGSEAYKVLIKYKDALAIVNKFKSEKSSHVRLGGKGSVVLFKSNKSEVRVNSIQENFNSLYDMLKTNYKNKVILSNEYLIKKCEEVLSRYKNDVSNKKYSIIKLRMEKGKLFFSEYRFGDEEKVEKELPFAERSKDDFKIYIHTESILTVLKSIEKDDVIIEFSDRDKPAQLRAGSDDKIHYLITQSDIRE